MVKINKITGAEDAVIYIILEKLHLVFIHTGSLKVMGIARVHPIKQH